MCRGDDGDIWQRSMWLECWYFWYLRSGTSETYELIPDAIQDDKDGSDKVSIWWRYSWFEGTSDASIWYLWYTYEIPLIYFYDILLIPMICISVIPMIYQWYLWYICDNYDTPMRPMICQWWRRFGQGLMEIPVTRGNLWYLWYTHEIYKICLWYIWYLWYTNEIPMMCLWYTADTYVYLWYLWYICDTSDMPMIPMICQWWRRFGQGLMEILVTRGNLWYPIISHSPHLLNYSFYSSNMKM